MKFAILQHVYVDYVCIRFKRLLYCTDRIQTRLWRICVQSLCRNLSTLSVSNNENGHRIALSRHLPFALAILIYCNIHVGISYFEIVGTRPRTDTCYIVDHFARALFCNCRTFRNFLMDSGVAKSWSAIHLFPPLSFYFPLLKNVANCPRNYPTLLSPRISCGEQIATCNFAMKLHECTISKPFPNEKHFQKVYKRRRKFVFDFGIIPRNCFRSGKYYYVTTFTKI